MIRRVPHASHWGSYTVLVEDNQIVGVEPLDIDPDPSPIIHSVADWAKPERRVLRPMVREGWLKAHEKGVFEGRGAGRGEDRFLALPWDEAEELVAGEIRRVIKDHGNDSIFAGSYGWTSSGRFHHAPSNLKRLLNLVGGYTGHVDTYSIAAGPVILRHTLGSDAACGGYANSLDSIAEHTKTLVVFGALTPRTAQIEAGGLGTHKLETHLRRIVERGVKVILISPSRDDLPHWVNADWWPIRPNTDTALCLGLAGEILAAGRHDAEFLNRCTSGADSYLSYLRGEADGQVKNARWAAEITGIGPGRIAALARAMVDTRSMITMSWSLQRAHHGEQPYWAALGLASVIGQIGLPGGGVGFGYSSLGGVGTHLNIGRSPAFSHGHKPNKAFIPVARITDLLENPGGSFTYEGQEYTYPDTRLVWWAGGNPYHHHQDLNRLDAAWKRPETIIVQDPMFTATVRRGDIILPATTSLERNDIGGNRRSDLVVAMGKCVEPLGEARSDHEIARAIAARLGVEEAFTEGRDEMGWIRHMYEGTRADAKARFGQEMPEFEEFWAKGWAQMPVKRMHSYLAEFREDPEGHRLETESGKIVLGSQMLADRQYADCPAHPTWLPPAEWLGAAAKDQLHLISNQPLGRLHSQLETANYSRSEKRHGREQARMHPDEAKKRGIADGNTVKVSSARGACYATATLTPTVARGVLVLPTGSWFTPGPDEVELSGNPNVLTPDIPTSALGQGCSAHTCLVRVEKVTGEIPDSDAVYMGSLQAPMAAE